MEVLAKNEWWSLNSLIPTLNTFSMGEIALEMQFFSSKLTKKNHKTAVTRKLKK